MTILMMNICLTPTYISGQATGLFNDKVGFSFSFSFFAYNYMVSSKNSYLMIIICKQLLLQVITSNTFYIIAYKLFVLDRKNNSKPYKTL